MTRSAAEVATLADEVELLLPGTGSAVAEEMVAVLLSVVKFDGNGLLTLNATVNVAEAPDARVAMVQITLNCTPGGAQLNSGPVV